MLGGREAGAGKDRKIGVRIGKNGARMNQLAPAAKRVERIPPSLIHVTISLIHIHVRSSRGKCELGGRIAPPEWHCERGDLGTAAGRRCRAAVPIWDKLDLAGVCSTVLNRAVIAGVHEHNAECCARCRVYVFATTITLHSKIGRQHCTCSDDMDEAWDDLEGGTGSQLGAYDVGPSFGDCYIGIGEIHIHAFVVLIREVVVGT